MNKYPFVPGRGVVTGSATQMRLQHLKEKGFHIDKLADSSIPLETINHNIESYIGSVEIPVGLAGPLLMKHEATKEEWVYMAAGTLEGALLASMNRGARVVSLSGGFSSEFIHQRMIRSPLFIFENLKQASIFKDWVKKKFDAIKNESQQYSNYAELIDIDTVLASRSVQLRFIYTTGDAAGQNMTTTCTRYAVLWIINHFKLEQKISPTYYTIEGNGSSDKKVSHYAINQGRGIHVVAECHIDEEYIVKILRTTPEAFIHTYQASMTLANMDGMVGYNINVANAIAAAFVATGQDLGSLHESSTGILSLEKTDRGLYFSLHLPNLVIGTVGGGTHLPKQKQALEISNCFGNQRVQRFARIIAGFALSLEISTFAAIVGGQFASSHEKLGRNKPVNNLTRSEIDLNFIKSGFKQGFDTTSLKGFKTINEAIYGNGILINLSRKVVKKLIGFKLIELLWNKNSVPEKLLIKSKPVDHEVIMGLQNMANLVDEKLSSLFLKYAPFLEYKDCHLKEIMIYEALDQQQFSISPAYYGKIIVPKREVFMFYQEFLPKDELLILDDESGNKHQSWGKEYILKAIDTIHSFHTTFDPSTLKWIPTFEYKKSIEIYEKLVEITCNFYKGTIYENDLNQLKIYARDLKAEKKSDLMKKVLVHNDFNSRNVVVRKNGIVCIFDWELATFNYPTRDIVEFLSFVLKPNYKREELYEVIDYYYALWKDQYSKDQLREAIIYSTKEYILTRVLYYTTGKIVEEFLFAERVLWTALQMVKDIEYWK